MCRECAFDARALLVCAEQLAESLRRLYLFRELTEAQLERLVESQRTRELSDGQWLFREGDEADRFFVVRSGEIALFHQSEAGKESVVTLIGRDEVFEEELVYLDRAEHGLNARAIGNSTVLSLERRVFRELLTESPSLSIRLLATQHRRQSILLEHIQRLTLQDATERVVGYLLEHSSGEEGSQRIRLRVPKHTLAAHLSIQPETLSRILQRLKAAGSILEDGNRLLLDVGALQSELRCLRCRPGSWGCPGPEPDVAWWNEKQERPEGPRLDAKGTA